MDQHSLHGDIGNAEDGSRNVGVGISQKGLLHKETERLDKVDNLDVRSALKIISKIAAEVSTSFGKGFQH